MGAPDQLDAVATATTSAEPEGADLLRPLIEQATPARAALATAPVSGVQVGELLAITDEGRTPLVLCPAVAAGTALRARSTVDLHGAHIGKPVVLMFENGDPARPIVMGVLREGQGDPLDPQPGNVEVDADGARMIVAAREQLVLRCGRASITLTKAGKVLIDGTYVSSKSSGVNRVKGGSVQLN